MDRHTAALYAAGSNVLEIQEKPFINMGYSVLPNLF